MKRLVRRLGSVRLLLVLLLLLALTGAAGTLVPQGEDPSATLRDFPRLGPGILALGLDRVYSGPAFRGLMGLLTANLLACSLGRSARGWRALRGRGDPRVSIPLEDREAWARRLREAGFRVSSGGPLRARRRTWAFLGFPLTHLALPVILAGGLWGSLAGFVGTQNVHVGAEMGSFFNWSTGAEAPLPFVLRVEDLRVLRYPLALRVRVEAAGGPARLVTTREGARLRVKGTPYTVHLGTLDTRTGDLTYRLEGPGGEIRAFSRADADRAPVRVVPLEFRDPEVRRVEALVAVLGPDGEPVRRAVVAINEPLVYGGLRIFLTAWGQDRYRFPYAGFQIVRDPGQGLVWAGAVALVIGLGLLLFAHGAWAWEEEGYLCAYGSRGRRALAGLLTRPAPGLQEEQG